MTPLDEAGFATLAGLCGGAVFGAAARSARYCVMGALEDAVYGDDTTRLRMLGVSAGVAMLGAALLAAAGLLDPGESWRLARGFAPAGAALGGLMFGYGMALVGTCAMGALARIGGGDIRSLAVVSVIGVAAVATAAGPLSPFRLWIAPPGPPVESLAVMAGRATGVAPLLIWLLAGALTLAAALVGADVPRQRGPLLWGAAVGVAAIGGWAATAALSQGFSVMAVDSFSFVEPIGEALLYVMTEARYIAPGFAVGGVAGVTFGAALAAWRRGDFRWETSDDARELRRQLTGAALMGMGGVLALGCTAGQGLTALSILAPGAPVAMLGILLGARAGLFVLVEGVAAPRRRG